MKPVDKLAARAGFKDGATAKAHYVKTETLNAKDGNKQCARKSFVSQCPYDLEDREV
ncbi:hypothetical protein F5B17DRAFT_411420 [Nemania serpens]|nr:hypothetical protein F5B17DRAFT_411420 [Nemania serpens]